VEGTHYPVAKANNFENLSNYFIQCAFPLALSTVAVEDDEIRANQILQFLIDLLRNNDNSYNTMSDNYYIANIIKAIGNALVKRSRVPVELLQSALEQYERFSKLERMIPYFRNNVMCAILETMSKLEAVRLLPPDKHLLQHMVDPGHYVEVRQEALKGLFRIASDDELSQLLQDTMKLLLADHSRKFKLNAIKSLGEFSDVLAKHPDDAVKADLWNAVASSNDVDWIQRILALMQEIYPSAPDDVVEIPQAVTLPTGKKAGAVAPIRISLQVHDLGSSDEEHAAGEGEENGDWLMEMAGEGGEGFDGHKKKKNIASRPIPKLRLQPAASASEPNHLETRMQESIQAIWDNYDSFPFRYPVDASVPGYHLIIKHPMDLSTIQDKIRSHRYLATAGLEPMIRDLRLMFDNCFTFNQPGSLIYDQAKRLRHFAYKHLKKTAFPEYAKMIKAHLTASEPIVIVPEGLAAPQVQVNVPKLVLSLPTTSEVPKPKPVISLKAHAPSEPVLILSGPATPPPPVKKRSEKDICKEILGKLKSHQHAYWFLEPIDPIKLGIPTYFEIIQEPMDFSTIASRLERDGYDKDAFKADVDLVFKNAKLFNSPGTLVHIHAVEIEKLFRRLWSKSFTAPPTPVNVDVLSPAPAIKKIKLMQSPVKAPSQPPAVKLKISLPGGSSKSQDFEERCKVILTKCKSHEFAWPFLEPVDPVALGVPTYFDEIPNPMDLSMMTKKLSKHAYGSHQEFAADFSLMIQNCVKFNGIDSDFAALARGLQAHFDALMAKAGLS
jgi:hypothetical protein